MSFDDKKFGTLFPTRTGTPTGTTNERKMLDKMGGSEGYRKSFQTNLDGSVTQCNTRNGMPEFITRGEIPPVPPKYSYYMESGQLEWSFPGDENPTRLDPAKWHFLDIPTTSDYLGKIAGLPPVFGAQTNTPELTEGMESQAIGYPYQSDPAKVAAIKAAYGDATILKKITAGIFAPSLYSGKMRLFVQAMYGSMEQLAQTGGMLVADVVGSSAILRYVANGASVQLGLWAHHSPGIYVAANKTWWFLTITDPRATAEYIVTAYQIKQVSAAAKSLLKEYATTPSEQLEGYLFAHSMIDTANPQVVGTFTGARGAAMAYGWKWNTDGSRASIVVHETIDNGSGGELRWRASTMHVSISYTETLPVSAMGLSVSCEISEHGEWTDGWGDYNIFIPDGDTETRLVASSIAMNTTHVKAAFSFSGIDVYGYYKDDEWTPVTLSRTIHPPGTRYEHTHSGLSFGAAYSEEYLTTTSDNLLEVASHRSNEPYTYKRLAISEHTDMDISFDGFAYAGKLKIGDYFAVDYTPGAGTETGGLNFFGTPFSEVAGWGSPVLPTALPDGAAAYIASIGSVDGDGAPIDRGGDMNTERVSQTYARQFRVGTGGDAKLWTFVIPGGDAEAAYIVIREVIDFSTNGHTYNATGTATYSYVNWGWVYKPASKTRIAEVFPWIYGDRLWRTGENVEDFAAPTVLNITANVCCFNAALSAQAGTPGGSYYALHVVDKTYPYYDRGMHFYTSAGKRYVGSEGIKSPESVNYLHRFVGWA